MTKKSETTQQACWNCGGTGKVRFLLFFKRDCSICAGVGRITEFKLDNVDEKQAPALHLGSSKGSILNTGLPKTGGGFNASPAKRFGEKKPSPFAPPKSKFPIYDPLKDPNNPANPNSILNPLNPRNPNNINNPANPNSPLNLNNPANLASPRHPLNPNNPNNPANPNSPLNLNNPANLASPRHPLNPLNPNNPNRFNKPK